MRLRRLTLIIKTAIIASAVSAQFGLIQAHAQDERKDQHLERAESVALTPRQRVIRALLPPPEEPKTILAELPLEDSAAVAISDPVSTTSLSSSAEDDAAPSPVTELMASPAAVMPPEPIASEPIASDPVNPETHEAQAPINAKPAPRDVVSLALPEPAPARAAPFASEAGRYGFFQTAEEYLLARGNEPAPQLKLTYRITAADAKSGIALLPETAVITLGPDYAMVQRGDADSQILDFKMRRLLTLRRGSGVQTFTNVSLFGARYQNINTVRRLTKNGERREIAAASAAQRGGKIGPLQSGAEQTLDAFYLESALGWAAAPLSDKRYEYSRSGTQAVSHFDGKEVFAANFNGPNFDTARQGYSFVALMFHVLPVHPETLSQLTDIAAAPTRLSLHKVTPAVPGGQKQIWQLTDAVSERGEFLLPPTAKSAAEQDGVAPLAFVIAQALQGRALGGPPDPAATLAAMEERLAAGDVLAVWLSAAALSDKLGGCAALDGLCAMKKRAQKAGADDPDLAALFTAFDDVDNPERRAAGIKALRPLLADPDVPGIIIRKTALALAKLPRAVAQKEALADLNPEVMLSEAIAKDPYDYIAYQGLAQIYAARGAFVESWDMADALRAFPAAPQALKAGFDRAEERLLLGAPGFFPPNGP